MSRILLNLLTGTASTGVTVTRDEECLIAISIETGIRQSETIFKMIKDAFTYLDITIDEVDGVTTLKGPGSFTGLRVGLAAAKAIAFAKGIPIFTMDTMEAIYFENVFQENTVAMMDARRDRVYIKRFYGENQNTEVIALDKLENTTGRTIVAGENLQKYRKLLEEKGYTLATDKDIYLTTKGLTKRAIKARKEDFVDSFLSELDYLKKDADVVTLKND